jgi:hypothetical protein
MQRIAVLNRFGDGVPAGRRLQVGRQIQLTQYNPAGGRKDDGSGY